MQVLKGTLKFVWHVVYAARGRILLALAAIALALVAELLGWPRTVYWALIGFSLGVSVGGVFGFGDGVTARTRILEEVYGEDWQEELSYGHYVHKKSKEARLN